MEIRSSDDVCISAAVRLTDFPCSQALTIYENSVPDSRIAFEALAIIVATLRTILVLSAENYLILANRTVAHASRLLRRLDQCKGLSLASLLFFEHPSLDSKDGATKAVETLQKAEAHAAVMLDLAQKAEALVEILDRYLWFYGKGNEAVGNNIELAFPSSIANSVLRPCYLYRSFLTTFRLSSTTSTRSSARSLRLPSRTSPKLPAHLRAPSLGTMSWVLLHRAESLDRAKFPRSLRVLLETRSRT